MRKNEIGGSDPKKEKRHENTRRAVENPNASGTKKQFYRRAEPHIHIKP